VSAGFFYLFQHGIKKHIYDSPVSTPNFFPGFYLLQTIRYDPTLATVQLAPDGRISEEDGDVT